MEVETFRKIYTPQKIRELNYEEAERKQRIEDEYYRELGEGIERFPLWHPRSRRGS